MSSRWAWILERLSRKLWLRASAMALLAAASALLAIVVTPVIPAGLSARLGADSVGNVLEILASSMLVVATFSVATAVSAYGAAAAGTTPRAVELLLDDTQAQNALATFVGAFLFSLVGIICLSTGAYGDDGRIVLFVFTIAVVVLIVATFLRWINLLLRLGHVHDVIDRVAGAARRAMDLQREQPFFGARPRDDGDDPPAPHAVLADATGYVQHVDIGELEALARRLGGVIHVVKLPGAHVDPTEPLVRMETPADVDVQRRVRAAFSVGPRRSFDQDPRHALTVLSEIGSKALSPGINDPGSATQTLDALLRVLAPGANPAAHVPEPHHEHVTVPRLGTEMLLDAAFSALARDTAGTLECARRLQEILAALHRLGNAETRAAARDQSQRALAHARRALALEDDVRALEAHAATLFEADPAGAPPDPAQEVY